jgi:hypothetical protein
MYPDFSAPIPGGGHATSCLAMEIYDSTLNSNTAVSYVSTRSSKGCSDNFLDFFAPIPGAGHATFRAVRLVLYRWCGGANVEIRDSTFESNEAEASVNKIERCYFLPKELSQIFAPIPGGGHATFLGWRYLR